MNVLRSKIYVYIVCGETSFSDVGIRNMGEVECQPFLKHSNHWKQALNSREACASVLFRIQFPEVGATSTAKESL